MRPIWGRLGERMKDSKQRKDLALLVERRRRELADRPDISQHMRELSQSSSRNTVVGPRSLSRRTTISLILGGLAVVALIACVASAVLVTAGGLWFQSQLSDPGTTVQKFYSALHQQSYGDAYALLTPTAKAHLSESQFTDTYSSYDSIEGVVEDYPVQKSAVAASTATFTVAVVRRGNAIQATLETLALVNVNGNWYIDSITRGGTVPVPSPTS